MNKTALSTTEALKLLLDRSDLWSKTGRPMRQRTNYKSMLNTGHTFPLKLKMKLLTEAGFTLKQEAIWEHSEGIRAKTYEIVKVKNCKNQG
ncbi:hypothetical protein GCM10028805_65210 [Spirosoma harenae]